MTAGEKKTEFFGEKKNKLKKQRNFSVLCLLNCQTFSFSLFRFLFFIYKSMSLKVFITSSKEVVVFFLPSWLDADERALIGCFWLWRV